MAESTSGMVNQGSTKWSRFLYWAGRIFGDPFFDRDERDYKLRVAKQLDDARLALEEGKPDWVDLLHQAIGSKDNNLTNWRQTQPLEHWMRADPDGAELAFRILWNADLTVTERFNGFAEVVTNAGLSAPISETSFFHMTMGIEQYPIFRATPVDRALVLTGFPTAREQNVAPGDMGGRYEHFLRFLDLMLKRGREAGISFRDRLDAQGASWTVTQWPPRDNWSGEDKRVFRAYQGDAKSRKASWGQSGTA